MRKRRNFTQHNGVAWAFVLPYLSIFCVFTVLPVLISVFFSFTDFNMLETPNFVGMGNYTRLFLQDDIFIKSIGNTFILALVTGPIGYLLCLLFAWFINELKPFGRAVVTLIFYAPSISGNMALVWQAVFSGDAYGYLNGFLMNMGLSSSPTIWLKDESYILPIVAIVALWSSLGTSFLTFIAGFQGVDKTYYEAGAIDGITNRWQELWYITLPLMRPQLLLSAVLSITSAFGVGTIVTQLAGFPSTNYAAHTIINHLQDYGTTKYELGYASAIATILFVIMVISNMVIRKIIAKVGS
ncbi:MAG: sugar ABC transporter permease [Ruminococcaceae bacterium]|nr:sugar ABC transporter permease [Oscillospiraceae bacterium]